MKIDEKDKVIISLFAENPHMSQEEIAKEIGLSQPSVAVRIKKLREGGGLATQTGIDPQKLGLYLAKVDISSNNTSLILNMFKNCPYFANGFTVSGKYNLCLLFMSENIATLEAIVNGHIRTHESTMDVDFNIVINSEKDFIVPVVLNSEHREKPPCGMMTHCLDCQSFKDKKCMGCPATGEYQGWFY